jgi:hypothetical protein
MGSAGYSPTAAGIDEARLDAYVALIQSKLTDLNTALSRDSLTPIATVTNQMVELGDSDMLWDQPTGGDIRIRVVDDQSDGDNMRATGTFNRNKNVGWKYDFITHIWVYLHPEALAGVNPATQASARQRALSRINDWLILDVFNYWDDVGLTGGALLPINSNIFTPTGGTPALTDALLDNMVARSMKPWVSKGAASMVWVPSVHVIVTANIQ